MQAEKGIIDGKLVASHLKKEIKLEVEKRTASGRIPGLAVIIVGEDPASKSYVRMKKKACEEVGIRNSIIRLPADTDQQTLLAKVEELNQDPLYHGFLVQSPLPEGLDEDEVIRKISPIKDVDGFHPYNMGLLAAGQPVFVPCTPLGVVELFKYYNVETSGKHVVVIGRSHIVGMPMALLLAQKAKHANSTVTICHSRTRNLPEMTRQADILIAAIGSPLFVKEDMVKEGAVVIDVGTNMIDDPKAKRGYRFVGDVDFENARNKTNLITPVPGGVGPMTVTLLLASTLKAEEMQFNLKNK